MWPGQTNWLTECVSSGGSSRDSGWSGASGRLKVHTSSETFKLTIIHSSFPANVSGNAIKCNAKYRRSQELVEGDNPATVWPVKKWICKKNGWRVALIFMDLANTRLYLLSTIIVNLRVADPFPSVCPWTERINKGDAELNRFIENNIAPRFCWSNEPFHLPALFSASRKVYRGGIRRWLYYRQLPLLILIRFGTLSPMSTSDVLEYGLEEGRWNNICSCRTLETTQISG